MPGNFGVAVKGHIYRSGFPHEGSFDFLLSLNLRSILCLSQDPHPAEHVEFFEANNIRLFHVPWVGNKNERIRTSTTDVDAALKVLLDQANWPLLVHCRKGKHRTGTLLGVFRRCVNPDWPLHEVLDEYKSFARNKVRKADLKLMTQWDCDRVAIPDHFDRKKLPPFDSSHPVAADGASGATLKEETTEI
eukprot:GABV01002584.1.p1 GENE.GABV01002584.1~~GABV01002584.1.p1  ORF type:complete len:215 (-),score=55.16 GABV01002584.1:29-598(-)